MHVFGALLWAASVALAFPAESQYGNHKTIKISPTGTAPVSSKSSPSPFPASYGHQNATNCSSTATTQLPVKATPIYSESMPTATYLPVVHWDKNTTGYYRLTPKDSQNFYYAEDGIAGMNNSNNKVFDLLLTLYKIPANQPGTPSLLSTLPGPLLHWSTQITSQLSIVPRTTHWSSTSTLKMLSIMPLRLGHATPPSLP